MTARNRRSGTEEIQTIRAFTLESILFLLFRRCADRSVASLDLRLRSLFNEQKWHLWEQYD